MASSKAMIALLLAFAVTAAMLPPSAASRATGFKPAADERHEAQAEPMLRPSAASGGPPSSNPALPGLFPPIPGDLFGLLFPRLGGLAGLIGDLLRPPQQQPGSPAAPQPTECMTPLMNVIPCTDYLTNITVLTPPGECCDGLKKVISDAPICLCHGMNGGDLSSFLPKPIDPVRMLVLPLACGTVLPLQILFMCSSSQVPPIMPPVPTEPPTAPAPSASP